MYLFLGSDVIVKKEDIVGIFELDGNITTQMTKEFLNGAEKEGKTVSVGFDLPKSFVVVKNEKNEKKEKVYFSHYAVSSLMKRMETVI